MTYEALKSFGSDLSAIRSIQLEAEHVAVWDAQSCYDTIESFLKANGFILAFFERNAEQSDSIWVQRKFFIEKSG